MRSILTSCVAVFVVGVVAACSSSSSTSSASPDGGVQNGDSSTPQQTPDRHRATATTSCPVMRAAGQAITPSPMGSACATDADCTTGKNGRCNGGIGLAGGNTCTYDECGTDAECGSAAVCECRVASSYEANVCFHGNCVTDADCGPGAFCSPSADNIDVTCRTGLPTGSVGFFCHTVNDDCIDDTDCKSTSAEPHCIFHVDTLKWSCFNAQCTG